MMRSPTLALAIALVLSAANATAMPVRVVVEIAVGGTPTSGKVFSAPLEDGKAGSELAMTVDFPGEITLDLNPRTSWRLRAEADGHWSEPLVWSREAGDSAVLTLWPTGSIRGEIVLPAGSPLPGEMTARFTVPGSLETSSEGTVATTVCPVRDGYVTCSLPRMTTDLRLRAPGFVSHYYRDVSIPARVRTDVGELRLREGASLVGRIRAADGALPDVTVVEARPVDGSKGVERQVVDNDFFHFEVIRPGTYRVTARRFGYGTASIPNVLVSENEETELEDLVLVPPLTLTVQLSPAVDAADKRWMVSLTTHGGQVAAGEASYDGVFVGEKLDPGTYTVTVRDSGGATVAEKEAVLRTESMTVDVDL